MTGNFICRRPTASFGMWYWYFTRSFAISMMENDNNNINNISIRNGNWSHGIASSRVSACVCVKHHFFVLIFIYDGTTFTGCL